MKAARLVLGVVLLGALVIGTPQPVAADHVQILGARVMVRDGQYMVAGYIRNTTSNWVIVSGGISFDTGCGQIIGEHVSALAGPIPPGGVAGFSFVKETVGCGSTPFIIYARAHPTITDPPVGTIGYTHYPDGVMYMDRIDVGGMYHNTNPFAVRLGGANAVFFDANGNFVSAGNNRADFDIVLEPGESYPFGASGPPFPGAVQAELSILAYRVSDNGLLVTHATWFYDAISSPFRWDIAWVADQQVTKGCATYRYCPNNGVTRAQMASFLVRARDLPATSTDFFTDDTGSVHEADINRLAAAGITTGCTATRFCPNRMLTRAEMASFLVRAFDLPATSTDFFADDTGNFHETDINRLAAAGITTGCRATAYCPSATTTRGQMAAFLHRAMD